MRWPLIGGRPLLAAYFARQARIRRRAIENAQDDIRVWSQELAEYEAAVDAALDDGVNIFQNGADR
jgi:hypothetical protein